MNIRKTAVGVLMLWLLVALLPCALSENAFDQPAPVDEAYTLDDFAVTEGLPNDWLNLLLMVTDYKYDKQYSNTDIMLVFSINLATREARVTSFMRDIWVSMQGGTRVGKLKAACKYGGPTLTMRTINEAFGLNLQYYALTNLSGMAEVIDILGGLDLDITEAEMRAINNSLSDLSPLSGIEELSEYGQGVHMNGNQATAYARVRSIDSDFRCTQRQRNVLIQIGRRMQQEGESTILGVLMKLIDCVETNMNFTQLTTITAVVRKMNIDLITQFRVPADGTYTTGAYDDVWSIRPDFAVNRKLIHEFIYELPD